MDLSRQVSLAFPNLRFTTHTFYGLQLKFHPITSAAFSVIMAKRPKSRLLKAFKVELKGKIVVSLFLWYNPISVPNSSVITCQSMFGFSLRNFPHPAAKALDYILTSIPNLFSKSLSNQACIAWPI